jgi:hypothetical protein
MDVAKQLNQCELLQTSASEDAQNVWQTRAIQARKDREKRYDNGEGPHERG